MCAVRSLGRTYGGLMCGLVGFVGDGAGLKPGLEIIEAFPELAGEEGVNGHGARCLEIVFGELGDGDLGGRGSGGLSHGGVGSHGGFGGGGGDGAGSSVRLRSGGRLERGGTLRTHGHWLAHGIGVVVGGAGGSILRRGERRLSSVNLFVSDLKIVNFSCHAK